MSLRVFRRCRDLAFRRRNAVVFTAVLAVGALVASRAEALYLFYMRRDLARIIAETPEQVVGKQVVVTDEVLVLWPDVQERPTQLNGQRYVLFDTTFFHCAIPADRMETHLESIWEDARKGYGEAIEKIEAVNKQEHDRELSMEQANEARRNLYWELYRVWSNKPIVTIFGTVDRADFWGPVRGKNDGVATETVSIVVDRVERPRRRWYESLDGDD